MPSPSLLSLVSLKLFHLASRLAFSWSPNRMVNPWPLSRSSSWNLTFPDCQTSICSSFPSCCATSLTNLFLKFEISIFFHYFSARKTQLSLFTAQPPQQLLSNKESVEYYSVCSCSFNSATNILYKESAVISICSLYLEYSSLNAAALGLVFSDLVKLSLHSWSAHSTGPQARNGGWD